MPYVEDYKRPLLDSVVEVLEDADIKADGDLNYVLFAYFLRHINLSYNHLKNFCGELRYCADEIERRFRGPYEDEKIKENGDVG